MKAGTSLAKPRAEGDSAPPAGAKAMAASVASRIPGFTPRSEDAIALRLRRVAPVRLVLGAGGLSVLMYLGFVLAFPIFTLWDHPHVGSDPNIINDLGHLTGFSPFAAGAFVAAILSLFACQFFALIAVSQVKQTGKPKTWTDRLVRRVTLFAPVVFAALMICMQPVTTTDLYGYIARGYLLAHLHLNPMTNAATQLPGGLIVNRPDAPYGPVWLLISGLVSKVAGENLLFNMLIFKFIGFAGVVVALWLVDTLALRLFPERRLRIYVLVGWSPLLIFECVGNGHNDIIMVLCVLAAFLLMLNEKSRSAFAFLVLGALIKYFSAAFIPLWLVYELRHRVRNGYSAKGRYGGRAIVEGGTLRLWASTAVSTVREIDARAATALIAQVSLIGAVLVGMFYAPFWDGLHTFTGIGTQLRPLYYNSSLVGFFTAPLQIVITSHAQQAALDKVIRMLFYALFAVYAYIQAQRLWMLGPQATLREVITASAKITFAALILITFWFQPWYVVWLLPLAALSTEPFVRRQGTALACGALLTYAVANFLLVGEKDIGRDLFVQFFEVLVAFGPLLLLRAAPYNEGWIDIVRRYGGLLSDSLGRWPVFWERLMVALILIVAGLLRLVRLGNLFAPVASGSADAALLQQISGQLRVGITDPQGLHTPFDALQSLMVAVFGNTPFALLLPSAVFGSITVFVIYLLTSEILRPGNRPGRRAVMLLAALLAATSRWHVSLSRSGVEVVTLPLLLALSVYLLLLALRMSVVPVVQTAQTAPAASAAGKNDKKGTNGAKGTNGQNGKNGKNVTSGISSSNGQNGSNGGNGKTPSRSRGRHRSQRALLDARVARARRERQRMLLFIGCGVSTGLACDVAPGLWLVPLVVIGVCLVWRWWHPRQARLPRGGVIALAASTVLTGIPVIWHYVSPNYGFPTGSDLLAKSSAPVVVGPGVVSREFWGQVLNNAWGVLKLLISQDYSAGYPSSGGTPIIPSLLGPFFYIGLIVILWRWRGFSSQALLLLLALPFVASIAVGVPTGVIAAASVLPAMCIIPAIGIYETMSWLGHLPIVLDRVSGVRVFSTPEQIGRILLLVFMVVSTIRTFFWYFEVTLPTTAPNQYVPTYVGPRIAHAPPNPPGTTYVITYRPD